ARRADRGGPAGDRERGGGDQGARRTHERRADEGRGQVSDMKVWFITGAGRGMGADIARAVLAAGHAVVATGRDTDRIAAALGQSENLLPVKLDVTSRADAEAAVHAAVS